MTLILAEALQELEECRQRRAVWYDVVAFLSKFIDEEVREAGQGIVAEGCIGKLVPQGVLKDIVEGIEDEKIEPLNEAIGGLENLQVKETNDDEAKTQGKKKVRKARKAKAPKNPKAIRAIPGGTG